MGFLRVECRCTNFRQAWANKDTKITIPIIRYDLHIKYQVYIFQTYTTIIFGVTIANADRKVGKIKVGAPIIAKRW